MVAAAAISSAPRPASATSATVKPNPARSAALASCVRHKSFADMPPSFSTAIGIVVVVVVVVTVVEVTVAVVVMVVVVAVAVVNVAVVTVVDVCVTDVAVVEVSVVVVQRPLANEATELSQLRQI